MQAARLVRRLGRHAVAVLPGPQPVARTARDKNAALINLHLATGQIGKPGAGPFSLTGQPNAMGGREVGGMANLLSAHRDLANPAHRAEVARLWGVAEVPAKPGKTAVEMFEAVRRRRDQGAVDRLHQPGAVDARPGDACARALAARRVRGGAGGLSRPPTPATTPTCCCRRRPGARRKARSPTPSAASRACAPRCRRRARRAPTGRSRSISRGGSGARSAHARAPTLFPYSDAEAGLERAPRNARAAAISTSPA